MKVQQVSNIIANLRKAGRSDPDLFILSGSSYLELKADPEISKFTRQSADPDAPDQVFGIPFKVNPKRRHINNPDIMRIGGHEIPINKEML